MALYCDLQTKWCQMCIRRRFEQHQHHSAVPPLEPRWTEYPCQTLRSIVELPEHLHIRCWRACIECISTRLQETPAICTMGLLSCAFNNVNWGAYPSYGVVNLAHDIIGLIEATESKQYGKKTFCESIRILCRILEGLMDIEVVWRCSRSLEDTSITDKARDYDNKKHCDLD